MKTVKGGGEGTLFGLVVKKFTEEELDKLAKDMAEGVCKKLAEGRSK